MEPQKTQKTQIVDDRDQFDFLSKEINFQAIGGVLIEHATLRVAGSREHVVRSYVAIALGDT